jgi:hypothetical protein
MQDTRAPSARKRADDPEQRAACNTRHRELRLARIMAMTRTNMSGDLKKNRIAERNWRNRARIASRYVDPKHPAAVEDTQN